MIHIFTRNSLKNTFNFVHIKKHIYIYIIYIHWLRKPSTSSGQKIHRTPKTTHPNNLLYPETSTTIPLHHQPNNQRNSFLRCVSASSPPPRALPRPPLPLPPLPPFIKTMAFPLPLLRNCPADPNDLRCFLKTRMFFLKITWVVSNGNFGGTQFQNVKILKMNHGIQGNMLKQKQPF